MPIEAPTQSAARNRRWLWWAIPSGCAVLLLLAAGGLFGLLYLVNSALGEAEAYTQPLSRAQASAEVRALLGEPIEPGWLPQGQIQLSNDEGEARLSIPISGPRGEAVIEVRADKIDGRWRYQRMEVVPAAGGEGIDLRGIDAG